ncbi:HAMP domain-containing protein [Rhodovastum atsumiense]|uniref:HAMP domain-containing protein n=1 Tax=Rhodovastum atsumiense TaxID=504468 RepID=A0A5M6IU38_9PROT|nr:CHASE3 domain-containing protein [Rhodovastum atsumiense]KAA5611048.1 HAMP domain-containing protein [Rhodovastum atsumiense]
MSFGAIIGIVLLANIMTYQQLSTIQESIGWTLHTQDVLRQAERIQASMTDQETGVRGYLVSADRRFLEPTESGRTAYATGYAQIRQLTADNPAQQQRLQEMNRLVEIWQRDIAEREITLMSRAETQDEARRLEASAAGKAAMDGIRAKLNEIKQVEEQLLAQRSARQGDAFSTPRLITIGDTIISILAALAAGALLTKVIAAPLAAMTAAMRRMSENDLTVPIPGADRRDEIGAMAGVMQVFRDGLATAGRLAAAQEAERQAREQRATQLTRIVRDFEGKVASLVEHLSSAATEMQGTATSMATTAEQTTRQATTAADAALTSGAGVQNVASAAEELSSSISEISRQVSQSARISERAVADARRTDTTVRALADGAGKIGKVIDLISSIAGQTNLLALNATIEAARAGEAGRGFAVVASEVKNLAQQTARATGEISEQVAALQETTNQAVEAIRRITATIEESSAIATTIASAVEEQGAATSEIARNVQQAASAGQTVTHNISGVSEAAQTSGAAAVRVLGAAGDLSRRTGDLSKEVQGFVSAVRAA